MTARRHTIYGLRLKGEKEVRYIGQTVGHVEMRLAGHVTCAARRAYGINKDLSAWLLENVGQIEAFKIAYAESRAEALGIEKAIIALCLRLEHRLLNQRGVPPELRLVA